MIKMKNVRIVHAAMLAALLLAVSLPVLAKKQPALAPLTQQGEALKADYTKQMESLRSGLLDGLPKVSDDAKAEYKAALAAEAKAKAELESAQDQLGEIGQGKGLIGHAKNHWIPKADRGIKAAKDALAKAKTQAERDKANAELKNWQDNRKAGEDALKERTAAYEKSQGRRAQAQAAGGQGTGRSRQGTRTCRAIDAESSA